MFEGPLDPYNMARVVNRGIDHRDKIFYERMVEYLEQGDAVAFVGAPHVPGVSKLLREAGYQIKGPGIPEVGRRS